MAHSKCNLKRLEKRKVFLFCHNLCGYDSHFLLKTIGSCQGITNLSGLPSSSCERMRTLNFNCYVLLDSAAFLGAPLSELVSDLARGSAPGVGVGGQKAHDFSILDQSGLYKVWQKERKNLLLRKGVCSSRTTEYISEKKFIIVVSITPSRSTHTNMLRLLRC